MELIEFAFATLVKQMAGFDDEKDATSDDYTYILAIGSSGKGKSQHLKLLTGNDGIKVGARSSAERTTTETCVFSSKLKELSNYKFIDTQGTEDSTNSITDEQVLKKSQIELYNLKADKIKILWFVDRHDKAIPSLQTQANYISMYGENIWDSVYIIIKQPDFELLESAQGALESIKIARKNSKNKDFNFTNFTGYKCIDWVGDKEKKYIERICKSGDETRIELRLLYENEIKMKLIDIICDKLQACNIFFRDSQCVKCGLIADKRFGDSINCHANFNRKHYCHVSFVHSGNKVSSHKQKKLAIEYHPKENEKKVHEPGVSVKIYHENKHTIEFHPESYATMRHKGHLKVKHIENKRKRKCELFCPKCEKGNNLESYVITTAHFMGLFYKECYKCEKKLLKDEHFWICKTCNRNICKNCIGEDVTTETSWKTTQEWSECGCNYISNGCFKFCQRCSLYWDDKKSKGCMIKYQCCNTEIDKTNDNKNNNNNNSNDGCVHFYTCCNKDDKLNNEGCCYQCCHKKVGSQGCQTKESKVYPCCNGTEQEPCNNYYDCCQGSISPESEGCKREFACEKGTLYTIEEYNNIQNDKTKGCQKLCKNCDAEWGTPTKNQPVGGCLPDVKHEWKDK